MSEGIPVRSEATEGEFSVTMMRKQVSLAMSGTTGHHGDVLDAVMAVVGSVERERDEARASVEHLRGDYRRIRKDRDRLLLAWRSAHRRANRFRWLHAEAVWQRDQTLPEWQCPGCGATTRARMADYPTERDGAAQIAAERRRVVTAKGYDAAHDDQHVHGELLDAARCYFNQGLTYFPEFTSAFGIDAYSMYDQNWPWWKVDEPAGWKPSSDPVRNLVKAGQFIAAEIDRLHRAAGTP